MKRMLSALRFNELLGRFIYLSIGYKNSQSNPKRLAIQRL